LGIWSILALNAIRLTPFLELLSSFLKRLFANPPNRHDQRRRKVSLANRPENSLAKAQQLTQKKFHAALREMQRGTLRKEKPRIEQLSA
jgi:hypothetical protein